MTAPAASHRVTTDAAGAPILVKTAASEVGRARLAHEATVLRTLGHPGLVRVVALVERDDRTELHLAWVGPHTLATVTSVPAADAGRVVARVAEVVADLHERGVTHTRLTPDHVLLGADAQPVLTGLADATSPGRGDPTSDVAALGSLLSHLVRPAHGGPVIPDRRRRRARDAGLAGALLTVADLAAADDRSVRPSARDLAARLRAATGPATVRRAGSGWRPRLRRLEPPPDPVPPRPPVALDVPPVRIRRRDDDGAHPPGAERPSATTGPAVPPQPDVAARPPRSVPMSAAAGPDGDSPPSDDVVSPEQAPSPPRPGPAGDAPRGPGAGRPGSAPATPSSSPAPGPTSAAHRRLPSDVPEPRRRPAAAGPTAAPRRPRHPAPVVRRTTASGEAEPPPPRARTLPAAGPRRERPGAEGPDGRRHRRRAERPRPPRHRRALGAVLGAAVLLSLGAALALRPEVRTDVAVRSSPTTTAPAREPARATTPPPAPSTTAGSDPTDPAPAPDAPRTGPEGPCPAVAVPAADVDGDGCPDALRIDRERVRVGATTWVVGRPGDAVVVADWDCDGTATAASLRPSTGEVFVFDRWVVAGDELTVEATTTVPGADVLRAIDDDGDGCATLVAAQPDGSTTPVPVQAA